MKTYLSTLLIMIFIVVMGVQAQEAAPQIIYYLAADENDVQQVYQLVLGGDNEDRQITYAVNDIVTFGAAHDGLSVAYISDGQLWLQPLHTEEPEALAEMNATQFFSEPVYSQDGQYVAYTDNGVWLYDLSAHETRQLLENVEPAVNGINAGEFHIFQPEMFIADEDGNTTHLMVDVGVWEAETVGVYDLETEEFQELADQYHTDALPLSDGRLLLYGSSPIGFGSPTLDIVEDLSDINTFTEVFKLEPINDMPLFAEQAVEVEPGVVRVLGWTLGDTADSEYKFYFDFNIETGETSDMTIMEVTSIEESQYTIYGNLSPDGTLMPVHLNVEFTETGSMHGGFRLVDITTEEAVEVEFPETVGIVRWQE